MKIIIIESNGYWVTEDQHQEILKKHDEIMDSEDPNCAVIMSNYLEGKKRELHDLGPISYDFRL